MIIKAFKFKLYNNMAQEYERRHNEIWPEVVEMIKKHGGEIMLSSDCHDKNYLDFAFDKAAALARETGFTRAAVIKNGKTEYIKL